VRGLSPDVQALADQAFMETVIRLRRAGEGAAYTGLRAAGADYDIRRAEGCYKGSCATGRIPAPHALQFSDKGIDIIWNIDKGCSFGKFPPPLMMAGCQATNNFVQCVHLKLD
jgi:hypothetical protein